MANFYGKCIGQYTIFLEWLGWGTCILQSGLKFDIYNLINNKNHKDQQEQNKGLPQVAVSSVQLVFLSLLNAVCQ